MLTWVLASSPLLVACTPEGYPRTTLPDPLAGMSQPPNALDNLRSPAPVPQKSPPQPAPDGPSGEPAAKTLDRCSAAAFAKAREEPTSATIAHRFLGGGLSVSVEVEGVPMESGASALALLPALAVAQPEVLKCFCLPGAESLSRVHATWTVSGGGDPSDIRVAGTGIEESPTASCIANLISTLRFPADPRSLVVGYYFRPEF